MKLSLSWLNDYVNVEEFFDKPEELGALLTRAGLELESIENQKQQFANVVIGKIIEKSKHEDADKLTVCKVDVGTAILQQIVCGAKNHKQGDFVVAALPGAVLPGDFKIKKSKIRGVESLGMLCSEKEVGLSEASDGIMVLKEGKPGEAFADKFKLNDVIFDISVTPNRADCLSHLGLAREVSCLLGREWKFSDPVLKLSAESVKAKVNLKVKNSELCPRYAGRLMTGVQVKESPAWLKQKLQSVDINSINNVVDATNFVMLEMGQPLHAFDLKELKGGSVTVALAKKGEKFTTLDSSEITLTGEELTIRDGERPVALAGVIGGLNSGVSQSTTEIFIEAAYFNSKGVRRTSRKYGIDTDSAYRFSRGTDPNAVVKAMNRVCEVIQELAGGEVSKDFYDLYPKPIKEKEICVSQEFIEQKMGYKIDPKEFEVRMKRLSCVVSGKPKEWKVKAPLFRPDLIMDVDLVEEFGRLHGYENIPETLPKLTYEPTKHDALYVNERSVELALLAEGYMQAVNYSFISAPEQLKFLGNTKTLNTLGLLTASAPVEIKNPLNEDLNSMRMSLLPGLMKNLIHNVRHGNTFGRLYEFGACFDKSESEYSQHYNLAFMSWGRQLGLWNQDSKTPLVYELKSTVENTLTRLGLSGFEWRNASEAPGFLHPGQWASLFLRGKNIGFIGSIHPGLIKKNKIREEVVMAEFNFESLFANKSSSVKFKHLSKYPAVERDLAFVMPSHMAAVDVEKQIKKSAGKVLSSVTAFDVYEGEHLKPGEKSISFKIFYQDQDKTLSEEELTSLQQQVIKGVTEKLKIRVR